MVPGPLPRAQHRHIARRRSHWSGREGPWPPRLCRSVLPGPAGI